MLESHLSISNIEKDMDQLYDFKSAVEDYGLTNSSLFILAKHNLLKSTSIPSLALESANDPITSTVALEAIDGAIRDKTAQWAAKIIGFFKDKVNSILEKTVGLLTSVKLKAAELKDRLSNGFSSASKTISTHPYESIAVAIAAAIATVGIISFVGTSIPVGVVTNGKLHSFMMRLEMMYNKIKFPFGKVKTTAISDGRLVFATVELGGVANKSKLASVSGWTKESIASIVGKLDYLISSIKKSGGFLWNRVVKPAEKVVGNIVLAPKDLKDYLNNKTGMRTVGWAAEKIVSGVYYSILYKLIKNIWEFTKTIVVKTCNAIKETISSLTKALA